MFDPNVQLLREHAEIFMCNAWYMNCSLSFLAIRRYEIERFLPLALKRRRVNCTSHLSSFVSFLNGYASLWRSELGLIYALNGDLVKIRQFSSIFHIFFLFSSCLPPKTNEMEIFKWYEPPPPFNHFHVLYKLSCCKFFNLWWTWKCSENIRIYELKVGIYPSQL